MVEMTVRNSYFSEACAAKINEQVTAELTAFYAYQALSNHFASHYVALYNVAALFKKMAHEEVEHAELFQEYLIRRGADLSYNDIKAPTIDKSLTLLQAFEQALALEQSVNKKILDLHALGVACNDAHLTAFLEDKFLDEQVEAEHELIGYIAMLKRAGAGLGEYIFDQSLKKS